ncbi:hypothetical protein L0222_32860 [bacterium]|nr:hypothetical protein [bacterium]
MMRKGKIKPQPVDALAHLLSGAMNEAALMIAESARPKKAGRDDGNCGMASEFKKDCTDKVARQPMTLFNRKDVTPPLATTKF